VRAEGKTPVAVTGNLKDLFSRIVQRTGCKFLLTGELRAASHTMTLIVHQKRKYIAAIFAGNTPPLSDMDYVLLGCGH
jgi:hypothetical protein